MDNGFGFGFGAADFGVVDTASRHGGNADRRRRRSASKNASANGPRTKSGESLENLIATHRVFMAARERPETGGYRRAEQPRCGGALK